MNMNHLEIEYINIDQLTPYENNARKHVKKDIDNIALSIERYGMNDAIGIWGDKNIIVEGHGRVLACKKLGKNKYFGNIFYCGNALFAVESMGTESLPTVIQSAIIWRGTENDTGNIIKIAMSDKFAHASTKIKQATLEKYFDINTLFGEFTAETLPTRNIRTYAKVENTWDKKLWLNKLQ